MSTSSKEKKTGDQGKIFQDYKTKSHEITKEQQLLRVKALHSEIGRDIDVFKDLYQKGNIDIRNFFEPKKFE